MKIEYFLGLILFFGFPGCEGGNESSDAYGNFEAEEWIISPEVGGKLIYFNITEGQRVKEGTLVGQIDTLPLVLRRESVESRINAVRQKLKDATPQYRVFERQLANLEREIKRTESLVAQKAATIKMLDDLQGEKEVVMEKMRALNTDTGTANKSILSEIAPLQAQIREISDQIGRCEIRNPADGIVLLKFADEGDVCIPGKALYKLADIDQMELRAFVRGDQLTGIRLGQEVEVLIDASATSIRSLPGRISWISERAEFTPKIIQTKEERVNLVYAVKVKVQNDGSIKIGMPGELILQKSSTGAED
jgi:HlyD family secretion protein